MFPVPPNSHIELQVGCLEGCLEIDKTCQASCLDLSKECRKRLATPVPRKRFTESDRRALRQASSTANKTAAITTFGASAIGSIALLGVISPPFAAVVGLGYAASSLLWIFVTDELSKLSLEDPIDSNFAEIASPSGPTPPRISASRDAGITSGVANSLNALLRQEAKLIGLLEAFVKSLDRSQGAAAAENNKAEAKQLTAARRFAKNIGDVLPRTATLRDRAAESLRNSGATFSISADQAVNVRQIIIQKGFPEEYIALLATYGIDGEARDIAIRRLTRPLSQVDDLTITFPDVINGPQVMSSVIQAAAMFRHFSRSLRLPSSGSIG